MAPYQYDPEIPWEDTAPLTDVPVARLQELSDVLVRLARDGTDAHRLHLWALAERVRAALRHPPALAAPQA
jgi:hypothetical protein